MQIGDLVHDFGQEVGVIMEVIDEETVVVLWPYDYELETIKTWQLGVMDSLFGETVKK